MPSNNREDLPLPWKMIFIIELIRKVCLQKTGVDFDISAIEEGKDDSLSSDTIFKRQERILFIDKEGIKLQVFIQEA